MHTLLQGAGLQSETTWVQTLKSPENLIMPFANGKLVNPYHMDGKRTNLTDMFIVVFSSSF